MDGDSSSCTITKDKSHEIKEDETGDVGINVEKEPHSSGGQEITLATSTTETEGEVLSSPSPSSLNNGLADDRLNLTPTPNAQIVDDEFIIFHNIAYLGASFIEEPKNEMTIKEILSFLNEESNKDKVIQVSVSIPLQSDQNVIIYEEDNQLEVSRFGINNIIFFASGLESSCFAFTCAYGESPNIKEISYQCHVFRCDLEEQVGRIFKSFSRAFESPPKMPYKLPGNSQNPDIVTEQLNSNGNCFEVEAIFEVTLEIKEDVDAKGSFKGVIGDKEKGIFRLRSNVAKQIVLTIQQVPTGFQELIVERCFGLLLSPGRHIRASDMQLIEIVSWSIGHSDNRKSYTAIGQWDSADPAFDSLNHETAKDSCIFFSVAVDLVIKGVKEPIRFVLESKARVVQPQSGGIYRNIQIIGRKFNFTQQFKLKLRRIEEELSNNSEPVYEVMNTITLGEIDKTKANFNLNFTSFIGSTSTSLPSLVDGCGDTTPTKEELEESDDDEPIMSGMGEISKNCSDEQLAAWSEIVSNWPSKSPRPKNLSTLIKHQGIPDTVRGEIWLRLAGDESATDTELLDIYRTILSKPYLNEDSILKDINRTFTGNEYFKQTGGAGQDLLFKISKAYAFHDSEIGYCQGISFIGATLLLQMPEEQAFICLVKIMFKYGFRDLFKENFENLHLKLYQLNKLIEEQIPELWFHFNELGIESHMYANQWLLTLFTGKFPLIFVFRVLDLFLLNGMNILFQVAIALLMHSRKDLLVLDFEGILKYFRVNLPKKYRTVENTSTLFRSAVQVKVKKLKKYENDYNFIKEQERNYIDPVTKLKFENKQLMEDKIRYDYAITNLVLGKATADENVLIYEEEINRLKNTLREAEDFNQNLKTETDSVKEIFQRELKSYDEEDKKKSKIISDYKNICSKLSRRIEEEQRLSRERMQFFQTNLCSNCSTFISTALNQIGKSKTGENSPVSSSSSSPIHNNTSDAIQILENELAKTKVALAESECKNDDLNNQLACALNELEAVKNSTGSNSNWLWKNFKNRNNSKDDEASNANN